MKWHDPKSKLLNRLWLSKQKQEGFTLVELLVAFLAITLFVALSLQGVMLASLAQIRARERAEASLTIQQNLEGIRALAVSYTPSTTPPTPGADSDFDARCKGIGGGGSEGMAAGLSAAISLDRNLAIPSEFIATASKRSYPFNRNLTPSTTNRNVLEVRYRITDSRTSSLLAELSTEVIPDVSLQCP